MSLHASADVMAFIPVGQLHSDSAMTYPFSVK